MHQKTEPVPGEGHDDFMKALDMLQPFHNQSPRFLH